MSRVGKADRHCNRCNRRICGGQQQPRALDPLLDDETERREAYGRIEGPVKVPFGKIAQPCQFAQRQLRIEIGRDELLDAPQLERRQGIAALVHRCLTEAIDDILRQRACHGFCVNGFQSTCHGVQPIHLLQQAKDEGLLPHGKRSCQRKRSCRAIKRGVDGDGRPVPFDIMQFELSGTAGWQKRH